MAENILEKLFEHNNWANLQIIQACATPSDEQLDAELQLTPYGSIRRILLHLVSLQQGYLSLLTLPVEGRPSISLAFAGLQQAARISGGGKRTMAWTRITHESGRLLVPVTQTQMVLEPKSHAGWTRTALIRLRQ